MKKNFIRIMSMLLMCLCLFSFFTPVTYAASSISFTGHKTGGKSQYFYVKTDDTSKSKSVKLTLTKGTLRTCPEKDAMAPSFSKTKSLYAAYEIKIFYYNEKTKTWIKEDSYDVYNKSSKTVTFQKSNTYYKVQIYQWQASTTLTSYKNKGVWSYSTVSTQVSNPYWSTLPKIKVSNASKCAIYNNVVFS